VTVSVAIEIVGVLAILAIFVWDALIDRRERTRNLMVEPKDRKR